MGVCILNWHFFFYTLFCLTTAKSDDCNLPPFKSHQNQLFCHQFYTRVIYQFGNDKKKEKRRKNALQNQITKALISFWITENSLFLNIFIAGLKTGAICFLQNAGFHIHTIHITHHFFPAKIIPIPTLSAMKPFHSYSRCWPNSTNLQ